MIYPGTLALSRAHLTHLADLLRSHRNRIGSRWRRLNVGRQALLVLAHLCNGDTYTRLAEGFAIGTTTVWRYVREAVDLLAAHAPTLGAALWRLAHNGHALGILDGTVVPIDRLSGPQNRRAERVAARGRSDLVVQRAIRDVGHCSFTSQEFVRGFVDLTAWVEDGVRPAGDDVHTPEVVSHPLYGCQFTTETRNLGPFTAPCP